MQGGLVGFGEQWFRLSDNCVAESVHDPECRTGY
jgi:hypothetical protein